MCRNNSQVSISKMKNGFMIKVSKSHFPPGRYTNVAYASGNDTGGINFEEQSQHNNDDKTDQPTLYTHTDTYVFNEWDQVIDFLNKTLVKSEEAIHSPNEFLIGG